jgi:hypothetical protein
MFSALWGQLKIITDFEGDKQAVDIESEHGILLTTLRKIVADKQK